MSTRDLCRAGDDELLDRLADALVDRLEPPASGLESLRASLDEHFGVQVRPVTTPLSRRASTVVVALAAALVALAAGLAWAGWPPQPGTPSALDQLRYATTSLRTDLQQDDPAVVALDVVALAHALAQIPTAQHGQVGTGPALVLTRACTQLAASASSRVPLPEACVAVLGPSDTHGPAAATDTTEGSTPTDGPAQSAGGTGATGESSPASSDSSPTAPSGSSDGASAPAASGSPSGADAGSPPSVESAPSPTTPATAPTPGDSSGSGDAGSGSGSSAGTGPAGSTTVSPQQSDS